jgi:Flp pilus assembly protein TadD
MMMKLRYQQRVEYCVSLSVLLSLSVFLVACGGSFDSIYASSIKGKTGQALFDELVRLDQAYPDKLSLKIDIGARLLSAGDIKNAKNYLDRGEKLVGLFTAPKQKYVLFADQAELKLREGNYKEALAYANKALSASPKDELGVVFTKAKAESALKDGAASLKDFDKGWQSLKTSMSAEDFQSYAAALVAAGRDSDAIEVLGEYQKTYPYDPGVGFLESGCYERLGDMSAAILCAYKDFEYGRASGLLSEAVLSDALDTALKKVDSKSSSSRKELERLVACIKAFMRGTWNVSASIPAKGFGEYIAVASKLEAGTASTSDLERYLVLEPSMRSFQAYYLHLWRGLRKDTRAYSVKTARPVLEKCIALAPSSSMALDSRKELGRLLGIGEIAGGKLLIPAEIDAIFADIIAGASFSRLDPVMTLLDTPDNDYQLACMYALGKVSSDPALKAYLAKRAKSSSGKLKERLTYILSM